VGADADGFRTCVDRADDHGCPAFSPVAAAAVVVTEPTTSPGQTSGGRCSLCAMCETHGSYHD